MIGPQHGGKFMTVLKFKLQEVCKMRRIIAFVLAFSVLTGLMVGSVLAGGGGLAGGATEATQLANNAELATQVSQLAEQINNQIKMVQDMINNTLALPKQLIGDVTGVINDVMGAYNEMQGILGRLSNLDEEFYNLFYSALQGGGAGGAGGVTSGDSEWLENYSEKYYELSKGMEKQAKKTLESLKVSAEDINDSTQLLQDLSENASTATGRNAILQAGNELLGFLGGELLKVRTLMTEQTKTYLDYAERQRTLEDAEERIVQQDYDKWQRPTYEGETFSW